MMKTTTATHTTEIERLIAADQDVIPFLQSLSRTERFALQPNVAPLFEKYNERLLGKLIKHGSYNYREPGPYRYAETQRQAVDYLAVCCCKNITGFRNAVRWNIRRVLMDPVVIDRIYPWYVPKWLDKELNSLGSDDYLNFLELEEHGYFRPSSSTLATTLPGAVIHTDSDYNRSYQPELLERYPATLDKHIWLLFEEPTNVHNMWTPSNLRDYPGGETSIWQYTFKHLIAEGKIDRMRVLRSCLLTCSKGFNQLLLGWFYRLFTYLEPTESELLALQSELFTGLQAGVSKAVTVSLGYLKQLIRHPAFDHAAFLSVAPQLLQHETKATLRTTLQLLEILTRNKTVATDTVARTAAVALATPDAKLQLRAAKLIARYGDASDAELAAEISGYAELLTTDSRAMLADYPVEEMMPEEAGAADEYAPLTPDNAVAYLDEVEELIFFVSRALDTEDAFDQELLLVHLPRLEAQMTEAHARKLDGVLARALQRVWYHGKWSNELTDTSAFYLNDYADHLLRRFPGALPGRAKMLDQLRAQHPAGAYRSLAQRDYYYPAARLLAARFLHQQPHLLAGKALEPLSLPTHHPAWVAPGRLIDRLLAHRAAGIRVELIDWQLALFRLPLTATLSPADLAKLDQLDDPATDVLRYFYGLVPLDLAKHGTPHLYLPALIARQDAAGLWQYRQLTGHDLQAELGAYGWRHTEEAYEGNDWDHKTRTYVNRTLYLRRLSLTRHDAADAPSLPGTSYYDRVLNAWTPDAATLAPGLFRLFDFSGPDHYFHLPAPTGRAFALLLPNHQALLAVSLLRHYLAREELSGEGKQLLTSSLTALRESWHRPREAEPVYLLLAASSLCNQKIARQLVGELWIDAVQHAAFDSAQFGRLVGRLLATHYAPPKRFTDLLTTLDRLGPLHDAALRELLAALLTELPEAPIKNLRKLLELYGELRARTGEAALPNGLSPKLEAWQATKSLRRVVERLG